MDNNEINVVTKKSKKSTIVIGGVCTAIIVAIVLVLTLVCFHDWQEATCTAPMTCSKCGKTEGETLPHEWLEATYTAPKTCKVCGLTDGEPLAMVEAVKDAYNEALEIAKQKKKDQNYSYLLLHNELLSLISNLNKDEYDKNTIVSLFGVELSKKEAMKHTTEVLSYVISKDGDYLSALMRKFLKCNSINGAIEILKIDISVNNVADLLSEMKLSPETLGRILAMLDIYDYSWIDDNAEKLLVFTDEGFTFKWSSVSNYILDLQYKATPLSENDFVITILDTNETMDMIDYIKSNYRRGGSVSLYDDKNLSSSSDENTHDEVYTERGVTVGSTLDLVFTAYGQTDIETVDTNSSLYKNFISSFDEYRKNLFMAQAKYYCKYKYENYYIYFCFNEDKNVSWIVFGRI